VLWGEKEKTKSEGGKKKEGQVEISTTGGVTVKKWKRLYMAQVSRPCNWRTCRSRNVGDLKGQRKWRRGAKGGRKIGDARPKRKKAGAIVPDESRMGKTSLEGFQREKRIKRITKGVESRLCNEMDPQELSVNET